MIEAKHHPLASNMDSCTGCMACAAICPENAIAMRANVEGFIHPQIDPATCNDCNRCRRICPVNPHNKHENAPDTNAGRLYPPPVFAAWHFDNEIRRASSSGGVFSALADHILGQDGVVAGAALDDDGIVRHVIIEQTADLHRLRGSKYVQSEVSPDLYRRLQTFLQRDRYVLFSGTPCQVAGLRGFLRKQYDRLFCCDLVCHGVPSPLLFACYLQFHRERGEDIVRINFRDKTAGWKNFGIRHYLRNGGQRLFSMIADPFMTAYLHDMALRLSCYSCNFTNLSRPGDVTMADFWGVAKKYPEYDRDDKGTSLVLANTTKGQMWLDACRPSLLLGPADLETAMAGNQMLVRPVMRPAQRGTMYRDLATMPFGDIIRKYRLRPPCLLRRLALRIGGRLVAVIKQGLNIAGITGGVTA